ncbi:MAG: hypothetical protein C0600_05530 [Ignavibacteria bacterium]|nr:MAG: hypothetical protein C0600_05530 [Ignavibacteria bacterium]
MRSVQFFMVLLVAVVLVTGCDEDDPVAPQEEHFEAIGVVLSTSGIQLVSILRGVTDDTLHAEVGTTGDHITVSFFNEDEQVVSAPEDTEKTLGWEIANPELLEVHQDEGHDGEFEFHFRGLKSGETTIELFIMHAGHSDFRSGPIPVVVK